MPEIADLCTKCGKQSLTERLCNGCALLTLRKHDDMKTVTVNNLIFMIEGMGRKVRLIGVALSVDGMKEPVVSVTRWASV